MESTDEKSMLLSHYGVGREPEGGETFESLADLFTVISFALIIAALVFGMQRVERTTDQLVTVIYPQAIASGGRTSPQFPRDEVLIYVSGTEDAGEIIVVTFGDIQEGIPWNGQEIDTTLGGFKTMFLEAKQVRVILDFRSPNPPRLLYDKVEEWITKIGVQSYVKAFQWADG